MRSPLHVMSTLAVEVAFKRSILPNREAADHAVAMSWGPTAVLAQRIRSGERADVLVMIDATMDELTRAAIAAGGRVGMLATFAPAVRTMEEEFAAFVAQSGASATLDTIVVPDAIDRLRKGDAEAHNRLVAERAPEFRGHDAVMLAHFSTSRALDVVRSATDVPVLSAPDAAVARMRTLLTG